MKELILTKENKLVIKMAEYLESEFKNDIDNKICPEMANEITDWCDGTHCVECIIKYFERKYNISD